MRISARTVLAVALVRALSGAAYDVTVDGHAKCRVLLADQNPVTVTAACELTNYVFRLSAVQLKVDVARREGERYVVLGGKCGTERPDEICLQVTRSGDLLVSGEGERGVLYGVYELLDRWGCRFWTPQQTTVPRRTTLSVEDGLNYRYAPPFSWRQAFGETTKDFRWSVRNRLNGGYWGCPRIPAEWGGSVWTDVTETWTRRWLDSKKYFKDHPEWYAWRAEEKKRVNKQLCATNPEVVSRMIGEIRAYLAEHPGQRTLSVAANDTDQYCQCKKCAKLAGRHGGNSAHLAVVANAIAENLENDYPDLKLVILAYWTTFPPFRGIALHRNVDVCCAELRDFSSPVTHPKAVTAVDYRNGLLGWRKLLSGHSMWVWDYYAQFTDFVTAAPQFMPIGENLRFYAANGVRGVVAQMPWGNCSDWVDLRSWLFGRFAWNPNLDVNQEVDSWINGAMGRGAPFMKAYLAEILKVYPGHGGAYNTDGSLQDWLVPHPEVGFACLALQKKALEATKDDPLAFAAVERQSAAMIDAFIRVYPKMAEWGSRHGKTLPPRSALIDELERIFC